MSKKLTVPELRKECAGMGITLPKGYIRKEALIQLIKSKKNKKETEVLGLFSGLPREMEAHIFRFVPTSIKKYVCSKVCKDWNIQFKSLHPYRLDIIREIPVEKYSECKNKDKYHYYIAETNRADLLSVDTGKILKCDRFGIMLHACKNGSLESAKWLYQNTSPWYGRDFKINLVKGVKGGNPEVLKWMIKIVHKLHPYYLNDPIAMALKIKRLDMFDALVAILYDLTKKRRTRFIGSSKRKDSSNYFGQFEFISKFKVCCMLTLCENKQINVTVMTINPAIADSLLEEEKSFKGDLKQVKTEEQVEKFEEEFKICKIEETVKYVFDPSKYPNILKWIKEAKLC